MITQTKVIKFGRRAWQEPIICRLARDFDITFSILKARILPRQEGLLILEISGENDEFDRAVAHLRSVPDVQVLSMEQEIRHDPERCTQCGACSGFCPSGALHIADRRTMAVEFDSAECIGCELCLTACPSRALSLTGGAEL